MSGVILVLVCVLGALWFVARGRPLPKVRLWPALLRFLPLLIATPILLFYFLTERGVLTFSRTENTYGLFVAILLPLSGLLLLLQLVIWLRVLRERKAGSQDSPR